MLPEGGEDAPETERTDERAEGCEEGGARIKKNVGGEGEDSQDDYTELAINKKKE